MKTLIFFLYGVIAYLVFFGRFSYGFGFVSTFVVPKNIDSSPISLCGNNGAFILRGHGDRLHTDITARLYVQNLTCPK